MEEKTVTKRIKNQNLPRTSRVRKVLRMIIQKFLNKEEQILKSLVSLFSKTIFLARKILSSTEVPSRKTFRNTFNDDIISPNFCKELPRCRHNAPAINIWIKFKVFFLKILHIFSKDNAGKFCIDLIRAQSSSCCSFSKMPKRKKRLKIL